MNQVEHTEHVLIVVQNTGHGRDDEPTIKVETDCRDDAGDAEEGPCAPTSR